MDLIELAIHLWGEVINIYAVENVKYTSMKEAHVGVDCERTPVSSCPSPGGVHEAISCPNYLHSFCQLDSGS